MSNEIKEIVKITPDKRFLYYKIEGDKLETHSDFFEADNLIIRLNGELRRIKSFSLLGVKIYGSDVEYDNILNASKDIELIYEAPDFQHLEKIKISNIEFLERDKNGYVFYLSFPADAIKKYFSEIENSIIGNTKLKFLREIEHDKF